LTRSDDHDLYVQADRGLPNGSSPALAFPAHAPPAPPTGVAASFVAAGIESRAGLAGSPTSASELGEGLLPAGSQVWSHLRPNLGSYLRPRPEPDERDEAVELVCAGGSDLLPSGLIGVQASQSRLLSPMAVSVQNTPTVVRSVAGEGRSGHGRTQAAPSSTMVRRDRLARAPTDRASKQGPPGLVASARGQVGRPAAHHERPAQRQAAERDPRLLRGRAAGWYGGNAETSVIEVPRPKASRDHPTAKAGRAV
jgi:hypothetical protein